MSMSSDAESVLVLDFGALHTRAVLFDVVEGQYRFIAAGSSPSTTSVPFFDVSEGAHLAIRELEEIGGRVLLSNDSSQLIMPTDENGYGVDRLLLTISSGKRLNVVVAGLLDDVSLGSAERLAATTYGWLAEKIGMNDPRSPEEQIDAILGAKPDIFILAGGADYGASRSVYRLADMAALICRLIPAQEDRPVIVYVGNQVLADKIKEVFERMTTVVSAPNIRPGIDMEELAPAQERLAEVTGRLRMRDIGGLKPLSSVSAAPLLPTAYTFGRMVRFLGHRTSHKGALGIEMGGDSTVVASGMGGSLALNTFPVGMGSSLPALLEHCTLEQIVHWLSVDLSMDTVRDYIWQKSCFPACLPMTEDTLSIERALARQIIHQAYIQMQELWPQTPSAFDPIILSGAPLTRLFHPIQSLLLMLDAIQPVGVSTVILDTNGLLSSLGAAARISSLLPVQVLESGAFVNVGTVIAPLCHERPGTSVLKVRLEGETGDDIQIVEVRQGEIKILRLPDGQQGRISLDMHHGTFLERNGKGGKTRFQVSGGVCGVVIDARGRPLTLPTDAQKRRELLNHWQTALKVA